MHTLRGRLARLAYLPQKQFMVKVNLFHFYMHFLTTKADRRYM